MNIEKYDEKIMGSLTFEYMTPFRVHKLTGLNWFVVFGFLCLYAMEGKIDSIKTSNNYMFRKIEEVI